MKNFSISSLVDRALIALISRPAVANALSARFPSRVGTEALFEEFNAGYLRLDERLRKQADQIETLCASVSDLDSSVGGLSSEVEKLESSVEDLEAGDYVTDKNLDEALSAFDFSDAIKDCFRNVPFSEFIEVDELADEIVGEISERRQLLDQLDEALVERRATLAAAGGAK